MQLWRAGVLGEQESPDSNGAVQQEDGRHDRPYSHDLFRYKYAVTNMP